MKKTKLLALYLVSSLAITSSVQAVELKTQSLGALKNVTSAVSKTASSLTPSGVRGTISGINEKLANADSSVQEAFNSLVSALSSKEKAAKIKAQITAINNNKSLNTAEKSAKVAEIMSDYGDTLKETQTELSTQLKSASNSKKTAVANSIVALAAASYQYLDIANDCKNIVMSVSANPTLAVSLSTELASLKDTASILKNNIKSLKNVTTQAVSVAKASGIEVKIPANRTSKAKKVDLSTGK